MSDRQTAAAGLRKGLELWPDEKHWCQNRLTDTAEDGTKQRCTYQMIAEGMALNPISDGYRSAQFQIAEAEIMRVATARGVQGTDGSVCAVNNNNDFATMKSIVEEAATNLEKVA